MKRLVWTCQRVEKLKKKSSKIPKNNYAATMVSAARRQIIGDGAPINKSRRRHPQIVGGGARLYSRACLRLVAGLQWCYRNGLNEGLLFRGHWLSMPRVLYCIFV